MTNLYHLVAVEHKTGSVSRLTSVALSEKLARALRDWFRPSRECCGSSLILAAVPELEG